MSDLPKPNGHLCRRCNNEVYPMEEYGYSFTVEGKCTGYICEKCMKEDANERSSSRNN